MHKRVKQQTRRARRPGIEEIEPRILYSADFAPALVPDTGVDAHAEQRTVDSSGEFNQASTQQAQTLRHEIVFVDAATPDYQKLIADIRAQGSGRDIEVVLLNAGKDGVAQITKTLAGREDVSAVHIVSHGADGSVQLGKTSLDFDSLLKNGAKIKGWGAALTADADILIYGCNVAQTDSGRSLVEALARLTGADVAASDDLTGNARLGGDWDLEFHAGQIETSIVFSQSVILDWNATLQGVAVGGETKANATTTGTQDTNAYAPPRSVAVDANGNYVVVWFGNGPGDADGVFFQRYNANGVAQGSETRVNASTTANSQDSPTVAMDASGNFVIAWRSVNQDGSGTGIYARRYNAAGTLLGSEFRVNTTTLNNQDNPNIAMNASGAFVVGWVSVGQDGDQAGVYAQRYNSSGVAQGGEFRVNTTTTGNQWLDSIAMDAAGNFIVSFSNADAGGSGVYMQRYNAAGVAIGGEVRGNTTTAGDQDWSSLAMAPDGDYVLAWRSVGQDAAGSSGIYAQRYNAAGVAQGGEFRVNSTTAGEQQHPAVAMDTNGNFMVVWASQNQDAAGTWGIYRQEYNADGTANGGEVRVNATTSGDQINPALAMNAFGQAVVAWSGNGPGDTTAATAGGVFFQRYATALVVDTVSNTYDSSFASGTVTISQLLSDKGTDGKISLREAIFAANNTANANANSPDRIYFNIAGAGVHTLNVTSQLPFITGAVLIDGTTQTGYTTSTPLVELDGQGTVAEGLYLDAGSGGSTIKGLIVNRFQWAIDIAGSSNNLVVGNFLGTNAAGTAAKSNWVGVWLGTSNNTVGGTSAADRNIISGNSIDGVQISGSGGGTGNVVIGNYIGLDVTGTADLGNTNQGVALYNGAKNNTIGGTTAGARNVISGNNGEGVRLINSGTTGNVVIGNYIGTNAAGTAAIANNRGVWIDNAAANNTIGGTAAGAGNTIAYNTLDGVALSSVAGTGNAILGNAIFSNGGLGIDLLDDNVTANDGAKTAGQPNLLMDFPVIQTVSLSGTTLTLAGYIGTVSGDTDFAGARVEFFKSADAAGTNGEGQVYLGFLTANASGNFSGTLTVSGLALGDRVTATATDGSNNTSEFGVNTTVAGAAPVATNDAFSVNEDGTLTIPQASDWWNTSWSQRKQLTFNNTGQAENLANFAVLVELDSTRINYALTQNAGQDLRFVDADGTVLAHEIETWNESGTSYVWVSVPQIDASSGSDYIWMYYGNASAPDTQNPDAVWDAGFGGVWHLGSNELDSAGTNDGINSNSTNTAGAIGSGQSFNGTNAQVYTSTSFNNPQEYTLEAWFRTTSAAGRKILGFETNQTGTASPDWDRQLYVGTDGRLYFGSYNQPTDSQDVANTTGTVTDNAWHYAVGVRNDATNTLSLYVDGVLVDTSSNASSQNYTGYWRMGGYETSGWPAGTNGYFNGGIDEARVSTQVRSAAWVKAQYLSMTDAFVGFGAAQGMGVLSNDSDPNGDALTAVLVGSPSNAASFTLNANGSFTYTPTANFSGTDTFTYRANDGTSNSNVATVTITVNGVNDAPTATITPASYAATEQTSLTLHGTGLSIADVDAGSGSVTATLSVVSGSLTVTAGTTGAAVSGSGSNSVTLTGTLTQINNLLAGNLSGTVTYIINSDTPPASDTLTLGVNDGGNTGSGGAKTGSDTATINISAVNDAPTATITPATYVATEQTSLTLQGSGLSIADADAASSSVTATLSVVSGTLTVTAGTTGAAVSGSGTNSVTLTGTLTQINNLLAGNLGATASYIISSDTPPASDTLTLLANDGGNTGSGGAKTGSDTATINIGAVNDAPTATITPATYAATEQTSLTLHGTGLSIADVDAGSASVTATLSVVSGTLTVTAGTTGAGVSGSGTNSVTLTGTLTQINNLLAGNLSGTVTYTINSDSPPASDTLTLLANDGGNTGSGGAQTGSDTATINIGAVNDAPTATITPATYAATEQISLALHGTGLSIADADAGSASVTATLSVVSGTLTVTAGTTGAAVSGSGTNSVTLTGTLTQINNLLAGNLSGTVTYTINSDTPPASDTLTLLANDGGNTGSGGAKTGSDTATINIGAVNDAPTATIAPATYAATEQTSLTLQGTGLSIADVDAGSASVTATLSVVSGTLTVTAGTTGAAVSGSGTNSVTLTGTLTQINNLLAGNLGATASYLISSDAPPASDTLTLNVNDGGNTGSGGAQTGSDTATINIGAVNDAPTATITPATYAATEQTSLTLHGTGLSIADVDAGSAGVTATLSVVSGTLTVTAGTTGAGVSGSGSNSVTLTGTLTQINNLLAGNLGATASYLINSDTPPASDTLTLNVNDGGNTGSGGAKTGSDTATINIGAVNDAPTATITLANYAATEQTSLTLHGTGLSIADVDAGSASVTATLSVVSGTLTVTAGTTGAAVSGSGTNSVTLTGTLTQINNLLAGNLGATASYLISSDAPPASDTLTLNVNDGGNTGSGGAQSGSDTATINIGAVNDAPTATITPATYAATEQTSLTLHGTGLSIADVDAGAGSVTATLSVVSGTLTVSAGSTGAGVSGSGSNSVTLTGTLTQINNLLAGNLSGTVTYIINSDTPPASDTLTLLANDGGNTGSGGAKTASDTATINIGAVNDAPTATITPATYAATEQTSLTLHGTGLSIADADAASSSVTATLSVVSGTLTVTAGTTGAAVSGSGTNSVTLTGTLTQINNLLAGNLGATASYLINSDTPPASDTLTLNVNDGGNTGSGGAQTGSDTATINIGAVNDAPVNTVPAAQGTTQDTPLVFSTGNGNAISVADVDAAASLVQITLTATNGTVSLPSLTGLTVTAGANGSATITVRADLATLNTRLNGLTFNPTSGFSGAASLSITTNDLGNTGTGGPQTAGSTINITVNPPSAPTASNDTYSVNEDGSLPAAASVLGNDTDPGAPGGVTAHLVSGPSSAASFVLNADGTFSYTPNANFHGTDSFTYFARDGGDSNVATVTITVNSVNDAPVGADKTVTTAEDTPYTFSAADFAFSDPSDVPANGLLAVTITTLPGAGSLTLLGVAVTGGQSISAADLAAGHLQFTPGAQANGSGYASFTFQVQDDGGTANSGVNTDPTPRILTIDVDAVNDAPAASIAAGSYSATEQVSLALQGTGLSIADVDAGGASVTATLSVVSGALNVNAGTTGAAVSGSGSNSVTLTGTLAQINALLAGNLGATASYLINSDTPPGSDTLTLGVNDGGNTGSGGAQSGSANVTINIGAVNDAPAAAIVPVTYAATEQTSLTLHGTGLSIADVDAGGGSVTATLSVVSGALTVTAGTTGAAVSGSGTSSVTLTGTLTQINNLLAGNLGATASYLINSDTPPASDTLTLSVDDGGNSGSGGAQSASDSAIINIGAVNDAPTAAIVPASYAATEQTSLTLHGTGLSIGDVDAGGASVTATLSVVSGTLTVTAGTTGAAVSGSGSNTVTLSGTLAQINALLAGNLGATASYLINSDTPPGSDTLTLSVDDGGNTGSGGAQSGSDSTTISIGAVNDAPTAAIVPATYAATEQTSLTLHGTGLSIADVDAGGASVTATLSVVSGTLTVTAGTTGAGVSGSGTSSVTLTGTLTQINNLLAGSLGATATYIIGLDVPPATDTLTLSVDDDGNSGSGGAQSGSDSAVINIGAVNDAPTASIAAGSYSATEQVSLALQGTGLSVGDVDAGVAGLTTTLSVVSGTLTVNAGTTGVVVGGSGSSTVTLTGTLAQINDLLAGNLGASASYLINSDTPPASDTLTLSVNDGGNSGSGGAQSGSANVTINIAAVNDAPTATITPATYAATEQVGLVLHGTGLSIADADAGGADITATLSVVSGALTVNAGTTGVTVGGSGTNSVTLTGTLAQINGLLAGNLGATAVYVISSDAPPAADTLTLSVDDDGNSGSGGAQSGSDSAVINIGAVNDAPTASIAAGSYSATEQVGLALQGTGLSIGDVDAGATGLTTTLSVVSGTLTVNAGTTGVVVGGSGSNSVTLTGTLAQINDLLAGNLGATASYVINSDTPPASDTLTLSVNDGGNTGSGGAQSGSANVTINIGAVNDPPTATIVPASYAATEQVGLVLHGTGLSIADADAGGADITATLSVVSGALTVNAGATGVTVGGSGTSSVTLTGTLAQINGLLAGNLGGTAVYTISSDAPPAADTLTLNVNDGGNSGSGGAQSGSDSATINIGAVNDAPTAAIVPASYAATEQTSLTLHGTGLSIADADAGATSVTATLSVVSGTLTATVGGTGVGIAGSGSNSITLTGTLTQINDLLAGALGGTLSYVISTDTPPASDTLTLSVNDAGNTGSGGPLSASDSATINIVSVNDAPTATIAAPSYAATEQISLALEGTGLSIADVDAGAGILTASLSVVSGTLNISAGTSGVSVLGSGSGSVTLTGTLAQINDLLTGNFGATASYVINSDAPPVSDTLTLSVDDGGNNGSGGAQTGSASVTIGITAVNDAPTGAVGITGSAVEDAVVTADTSGIGDADGLGAFTYQWARSTDSGATWSSIVGATGSTYALGDADVNALIQVSVAYTDGQGSAESLTSASIGPVVNVNDEPTGAVIVVGVVTEDQTLTADTSTIGDADGLGGFTYQWARSIDGGVTWNDIAGAVASTYVLGDADVGNLIHVSVDYIDGQGSAESLASADVGPVGNVNDAPSGAVSITGTVTEDQMLTADTSSVNDLDGLGAFGYQWLRNGVAIGGATAGTYTLGDADVGTQISVQVSYIDGHGTTESLTSAQTAAVANVNDVPTGVPTISGTPTEDQTLTADTSGIADADGLGAFGYQWLRDGMAIGGATAGTYTLGDADVGTQISVQVSYSDGHGTAESLTSAQTPPVANVNDTPVGLPVVGGTVTEDQTLIADTSAISDADGLGAFSYQWLRNGAVIAGATAGSYTLGDADVGTQISVRVSYTDGYGTAESLTSAQTAAVTNVNDVPTGLPTISGTPTEDLTLTADTSGIGDADGLGGFGYQWLRNGVAIGGATAGTYTLGDADVGTQISVRVAYTDGHGTAESLTSAQTAPVANVNDAPIGVPTISGTVTEDQTLTANTAGIADADGLGAFGYQWLRNGVAIGGATAGTYTLGDADVGAQISVRVSYTDGYGAAESLTSAQTAPVANVNDAPTGVPVISGTPTEDQALTADTSGIADADGLGAFSYQWLRNGVAIGGATAGTYTLGDADVGTQISVQVSYTDGHGSAEALTSAQTAPVGNVNDPPTGVPTISGTPTEDQVLTADTSGIGDADGLGAFSYQWLRDGIAIGGAIAGTYTLGDADVDTQISVQVSYTDGQGTAESLTSAQTAPVANVNDAPAGLPAVIGTPTEDQVLTADTSGISDADGLGAFGYQWLRGGVAIGGATAGTYTLGDADVGTQISVQVSYTDGHGTAESLTSAQTALVANVNDAPAGLPAVSGTPTENQVLTADTSGISDDDGLGVFSYQWLRDGVVIGGATGSTYTLGNPDVGTQISVQVSYTDGYGTAESLTSAQTVPVANVNDPPTGVPTISGTPTEDQILTADTSSIADPDGLGAFSYQWLRNGIAIGGASAGTYTLGDADVGTQISVQVSYTDGQGYAESLTSAQTPPVANINDAPVGLPAVVGTPTEDQVLTADTSGLADADGLGAFSYQWLRNGAAVGGAVGNTYTLGDADVGTQISVQVAYTDGHGTAESLTSAQTAPVANVNDAPTGLPTISGTPAEDQVLTANTSGIADADGLGAFSYQWLRDGIAIGGAIAGTYTLADVDVGTRISVQVSYTDAQGTAESLTSAQSAPVANVNDAPTGVVTIAGAWTEDQTLTADISSIADADGLGAFSYQWLRNGVAIGGATGTTYTLGDADVGSFIQVAVAYSDGQGSPESLISGSAGPVANVDDAPVLGTNTLTIGRGEALVLSAANLSGSDVDNPAGTLTFSVSAVSHGHFELTGVPGVAITSFTQADVQGGLVVFVHDGSRVAPGYAVTVSDGALSNGPLAAGVSFDAGTILVVPTPPPVVAVTNSPPAEPKPEAPAEPSAEANAAARVVPAVYSPGRVDPPEGHGNQMEFQALNRKKPLQPVASFNHFVAGPHIDPSLELLAAAPANLQYLSTVPVDWHVRSAFPEAEEAPKDRIDVLLEQVQLGGMALSVGVVWWASRVSGLLGSLLASAPAWRHIDPLPVVGRDEDEEKKWYDPEDRDADANELAIANVLEGAQAEHGTRDHTERG